MLCGKNVIISDTNVGEYFCGYCGYVFSERTEEIGPEWRSYDMKEDRTRTGSPVSLAMHDNGLTTVISSTNTDAFGKPLSSSMKEITKRLQKWDKRSGIDSTKRNFRDAFSYLTNLKCKLDLSDAIIENAAYTYRKAVYHGLVRGRSVPSVLAASLYVACRHSGISRTLTDISTEINLSKNVIARTYRLLLYELDLKMPILDPTNCISRIASIAGISEKTKRKAIYLLQQAMEKGETIGKDPMGMAAAALYLSSIVNNEKTSQRKIAKASNVCEITIRTRCRGLSKTLNLE